MSVASNSSESANLIPKKQTAEVPVTKTEPLERLRLVTMLAAGIVALVAFVVFLTSAIEWRQHAFFGAMLNPFMVVDGSRSITSNPWQGLTAGLQRLDHVTAINGQPLSENLDDYSTARATFNQIMSGVQSGDTITVSFLRPEASTIGNAVCGDPINGQRECTLSYTTLPLSDNDFLTYFLLPYLIGLISVVIGLVVLYLRSNQPAARMTALFCITVGLFMGGLFDINNTYAFIPVWLLATAFIGTPAATLALIFPVKITSLYRYPMLLVAPFVINLVIAAVAFFLYLKPPTPYVFPDILQIGLFWAVLGMLVLLLNLLRRRSLASTPAVRDQTNTVLIGLALTIAPIVLWVINTLIQQSNSQSPIYFNTSAVMPFFIMPPVSLAYAVLQYRQVDTDKIISRGITYFILLTALVIGYFLLVFGASLVTRDAMRMEANNPFLIALMIFVIAVLFLPVRTYLQQRIDQIYFRKRIDYQERVEVFARSLTGLKNLDEIVAAFHQQLSESISPTYAYIFLPNRQTGDYTASGTPRPATDVRFENNSGVLKLLQNLTDEDVIYLEPGRPWPAELWSEQARLNILKTLAIARLPGQKELVGFICIGAPLSDSGGYRYEELRFIQNLTNQMAVAVERTQAVETLERRVRELDILSQVSQAVNFTIQFDDLLELIYAQTDRLVSAPYFYIVLREKGSDKLFYAFFVEADERHEDKENRRWLMGNDLFSEVTRSGLPLRVENYASEMSERHSPIIYESEDLKAWMGVPLITGANTLGAIAVASTELGVHYTDDQMKIFSDIGALAANSLDKARLFTETNLRARQLSALNQISQKLASELNVQNLLELITNSAVIILEAEAGSLLLAVDDGSNMLEFKVAVGGSGQDLVGKRFPKGRGLVGEVSSSGKPVIVNDAATDPRWGGEVSKGGFSTSAVLAVPLIAQNRVIGVLEVLNKKDGGIYVKEDADLLTTFAGQAAVALENARLFEMTDLQLGQRVAELQALERIDVELNRSLDLQKVADITMRWAIANSAASAGILGLVMGEPPYLQIVSKYGYSDEDFPAGAEGAMWPLDRGIVSRVMRTRQPDLVNDVKIDRDYIPSLRGSLSQMTIPMLSGGEINAILMLEKDKEPRLSLVDLSFAQRLAEHASIAITNAQLYAELTRANDSKSEFVSFVAHELKTPMTSMKGFADLLLSGVAGSMNDQQSGFLGTIRSNIDRMNTLVSDLNDVTKLQTNNLHMEFSPLDFRNVVNETLRPLNKQIDDKHQIVHINLPSHLPQIMADQNRLIQVMTNLVSNSYKYSPPEGNIYINGEIMEHNLDAKGRDLGPALHIQVKDTGIGMSEEDLAKLFTPYFRSENPLTHEQPGTGLGLTITRGIIIRHNGNIWVESTLGEGSTFHFTIPLVEEKEAPELDAQPAK